ncbi:hypothetical protein RKS58_23660 [Lysinibacillus capsici]|uniref:hypothetical protein n=1 Tax=Lysinibacillus capsici TaxID=2115968 RepID=UPI0028BD4F39|nr:hypothetical protein [Lysinibacillus capsici]WNN76253.1 hypothetical protein RKS58_23660 [Lysinibacillus capsici]
MGFQILGTAKDFRTDTVVVYAKALVEDYLELVGDDFSDFYIQRKKETHKAYKRLKNDIVDGALLPTITLAVKPEYVPNVKSVLEANDLESLASELGKKGTVNILDGLQRTYILKELKESSDTFTFKEGQTLLLEFWLETEIKHLIYRLIVLNSGQKPMSMRHQVELLFLTIKETLEKDVEGLEIYLERDTARRDKAKKFSLDRIVTAYQSFVTKSPEVKRDNIVASKMIEDDIMGNDEEELDSIFNEFKQYLIYYTLLDEAVSSVYKNGKANWLADENVMNSFFAAIADFSSINPQRKQRTEIAIQSLITLINKSPEGSDPLAIEKFNEIKSGLNPKKDNIGFATRKLLVSAFKEFFREEGEKSLESCWVAEAK